MGILYGVPVSETYHQPQDRLIIPGNTTHSLIHNRIQARNIIGDGTYHGYSQMPPIATNVVDEAGVRLLADWIEHGANVAPAITAGSLASATVSENAEVGTGVGTIGATDPDIRDEVTDNSAIRYTIINGDPNHVFRIDPLTGQVTAPGTG